MSAASGGSASTASLSAPSEVAASETALAFIEEGGHTTPAVRGGDLRDLFDEGVVEMFLEEHAAKNQPAVGGEGGKNEQEKKEGAKVDSGPRRNRRNVEAVEKGAEAAVPKHPCEAFLVEQVRRLLLGSTGLEVESSTVFTKEHHCNVWLKGSRPDGIVRRNNVPVLLWEVVSGTNSRTNPSKATVRQLLIKMRAQLAILRQLQLQHSLAHTSKVVGFVFPRAELGNKRNQDLFVKVELSFNAERMMYETQRSYPDFAHHTWKNEVRLALEFAADIPVPQAGSEMKRKEEEERSWVANYVFQLSPDEKRRLLPMLYEGRQPLPGAARDQLHKPPPDAELEQKPSRAAFVFAEKWGGEDKFYWKCSPDLESRIARLQRVPQWVVQPVSWTLLGSDPFYCFPAGRPFPENSSALKPRLPALVECVRGLHKNRIAHTDIRPPNIVLVADVPCLIDPDRLCATQQAPRSNNGIWSCDVLTCEQLDWFQLAITSLWVALHVARPSRADYLQKLEHINVMRALDAFEKGAGPTSVLGPMLREYRDPGDRADLGVLNSEIDGLVRELSA